MENRCDVLVIGGGCTGTGCARDLAMRGLDVILVERGDICSGASGANQGILHSGGRYCVNDPAAAADCARDNKILRVIARHTIEPSGGMFVALPQDPPDFPKEFVDGAKKAKVEFHELSIKEAFKMEPNLNPSAVRAFWVNDGAVDPFLLVISTALSAAQHGADIRPYTEVVGILKDRETLTGAEVYDHIKDKTYEIKADMVVNAVGAWAAFIGKMAGVHIAMAPAKSTNIVIDRRVFSRVMNRLRPPTNGDIFVTHNTTSNIGPSGTFVLEDPDLAAPTRAEVEAMFKAAVEWSPMVKHARLLRAYSGVRPTYGEKIVGRGPRGFKLIDHETEDGLSGFITITGGKLTSFRGMAEKTADLVCKKLGVRASCETHKEPLPGSDGEVDYRELAEKYGLQNVVARRLINRWGSRAEEVMGTTAEKPELRQTVCTCEIVTKAEIRYAVDKLWSHSLDDIRRRTRFGMGLCQGGFCAYKVAAFVHEMLDWPIEGAHRDLLNFLRRRWSGSSWVAWKHQLRQDALVLSIFSCLGNYDKLKDKLEIA